MEIKRITPDEVNQLLSSDEQYTYVDVRTPAEYDAGHVPGAKNVPIFETDAYGRMLPNPNFVAVVESNFGKDAKLIVGCQMGGRSLRAAEALVASGFRNVLDMRGGFQGEHDVLGRVTFKGWALRGLPISTESAHEDRYKSLKNNCSAR